MISSQRDSKSVCLLSTLSLISSIFFYTQVYGTTYNHPIHTLPKATLLRSTSACWDEVSKQPPYKRDLPSIYLILWLQQDLELCGLWFFKKKLCIVKTSLHKAGICTICVKSARNISTRGGPCISWFLVPKGYHEIWGSRILKPFLVLNPKLGPKFF